jgi:predicted GNAT family acetyltransferase
MVIKISWAKVSDANDLERLDKIAHKEKKWWEIQSKNDFKKVINESAFLTLIVREDDKPIAYLQSGLRNTKKHLWIENIFVINEFRRKGIAKLLVDKFTSYWLTRVDNIVLITADTNLKIFEQLGFRKEMNYMGYKNRRKVK